MQFALTDAEALEALRNATRTPDGLLLVDLPACRLAEVSSERVNLAFDDADRVVTLGRQRAKLERIPYKLLKAVWNKGRVEVEDLAPSVWGREEVSPASVRGAIKKANDPLEAASIPVILDHHKDRIFAEYLG